MPILTQNKKNAEYKKIVEYLSELEIPAKFAKKGEFLDEECMVFFLPDFEINNFSKNIFFREIDSLKFATGIITQMDSENKEQLTKYLFLTVTKNITLSAFEDEILLNVLNRLNQAVRVGCFFYEVKKDIFPNEKQIKYQYKIPASIMNDFDIAVICESIIEMGLGFDLLLNSLTVL